MMIVIKHKFPKNCTECPLNYDGVCVISNIVDGTGTINYRDIDIDFGEGLNYRPEWCEARDSEELADLISQKIEVREWKQMEQKNKTKSKGGEKKTNNKSLTQV